MVTNISWQYTFEIANILGVANIAADYLFRLEGYDVGVPVWSASGVGESAVDTRYVQVMYVIVELFDG
jgi:hypothetical protein